MRPVYLIMKVVIRRIIWTQIIHLNFIGKTVLTTFECVTVEVYTALSYWAIIKHFISGACENLKNVQYLTSGFIGSG